ncbi:MULTISPECIES: IclR family transcriptional regulator domain-containing protein [unclassified Pseudonocardia]|uniref:IclR family transcriptional regulator domain-containing protein n=1 Tax=unclassified Pseudonocardia TaxID=2619320 RepID=UPI0006CB5A94|nr:MULTISPECIES: IclR family transcriptional regulator C-terminal domain-containing protein [unclassified Pseudonocardia]ALE86598.1 IclR family transcriptional regulator [Pseudonocardia sp. HH130629-09]ANY10514.1 IclR family transcriptional regulator [Pseudonocardia sp. HH130630-07]
MTEVADGAGGRDRIQSIERGFAVLLAFDADRPRPTSSDVAAATGLSRPAVRRILLTLQHLGYVEPVGSRWRLTPRVLSLGQRYSATHSIVEDARPHLARLAEETDESASLTVLDGADVVYVARVPVRRILQVEVSPGTRVPATATAMGRVLLAWAEEPVIARMLATPPRACTPRTVTDPKVLRGILREVQTRGWALAVGELDPDLMTLAAPVRDHTGAVAAAIASATSTGRCSPEKLVETVLPHVLAAAERLSRSLGRTSSARFGAARDGFY